MLRSAARCKVVLAVRTEYLGRLMDHMEGGAQDWRSFFLAELSEEQMLQAILLPTVAEPVPYASDIPAQTYRFAYETDVAIKIVSDVRTAALEKRRSPLPLLQAICAELYERAKSATTS